jgi:hypothetical protein
MEATDIEKKKLELSGKIDELIVDLKHRFLALSKEGPIGTGPEGKVGVWDRVKNWWNKLRYGKFGNLSQVEKEPELPVPAGSVEKAEVPKSECIQFSFQEYRALKNSCNELELVIEENQENLNEEESENLKNLKLFRIIDDWGKKFKQVVLDLVYPDKSDNWVVNPVVSQQKSTGVRSAEPTVGPVSIRPVAGDTEEEKSSGPGAETETDTKIKSAIRSKAKVKAKTKLAKKVAKKTRTPRKKSGGKDNAEKRSAASKEELIDSPEAVQKALARLKLKHSDIEFGP